MNRLYALLTYSVDTEALHEGDPGYYYVKKCFPPRHTPRSREICDALLRKIPADRLLMFVCFICTEVLDTEFGEEIRALDPENTYAPFTRDPTSANPTEDSNLLLYDLTSSLQDLRYLYTYLDNDIQQRLVMPEWLDVMAAACLQMLREAE